VIAALLIVAFVAVTGIGTTGALAWLIHGELKDERERTANLLLMLEAQKAPVEFAAVALQPIPVEETHWLADETGLLLTRIDD
jgi:hypothetical protein